MSKLLIALIVALTLFGCNRKEKTGLHDVLVEKFKDDQDLKDYNLDPQDIADCVVDEISASLPGFAGDPRRPRFFEAYARFLNVKSQADAEKSLQEFKDLFGSEENARTAATSITDHVMTCMGKSIEKATPNAPQKPDAPKEEKK